MPKLFGTEIQVLAKSLGLRAKRHDLIVGNLANSDTPGYKAVHLKFEETLKRMMEQHDMVSVRRTDARHFPRTPAAGQVDPEIVTRTESTRMDGNSVDMDEEIVNLNVNQLQFDASVETLNRIFSLLAYSVDEGGK
jgi:flagellar basal-body rod protein FlgB